MLYIPPIILNSVILGLGLQITSHLKDFWFSIFYYIICHVMLLQRTVQSINKHKLSRFS